MAIAKLYDNKAVKKELLDQILTKINLRGMVTVDTSLVGQEGMKVEIDKYSGTGDVEKVTKGNGNTGDIGSTFSTSTYEIECYQGRVPWFDEDQMTDTVAVAKAVQHLSEQMTNKLNGNIVAELNKAPRCVVSAINYDAVVDGIAALPLEQYTGLMAVCNKKTGAALRKALKETLQYVQDYARTGYLGTINGVSFYETKEPIADSKFIIFDIEAVTMFMKEDFNMETERDANTRKTTLYGRLYNIIALTNSDHAVVVTTDNTDGYTLLTSEPADFTTDYDKYYKLVNNVMTVLSSAETFAANTFYSKDF